MTALGWDFVNYFGYSTHYLGEKMACSTEKSYHLIIGPIDDRADWIAWIMTNNPKEKKSSKEKKKRKEEEE